MEANEIRDRETRFLNSIIFVNTIIDLVIQIPLKLIFIMMILLDLALFTVTNFARLV